VALPLQGQGQLAVSRLYSQASRTERLDTTARTDDASAVFWSLLMIQQRWHHGKDCSMF